MTQSTTLWFLGALFAFTLASPVQHVSRAEVQPKVKQATYVANVTDPELSRDSCGSTRIGDRAFWTCRDTEIFNATQNRTTFPLVTNSASWTNMTSSGPAIIRSTTYGAGAKGSNPILDMYGTDASNLTVFFPLQSDECPTNGDCSDGTRWVAWPDQPPVITARTSKGGATGYTFIPKVHLHKLTPLNSPPPYTLYKTVYTPAANASSLPQASIVADAFWQSGEIGYGDYGNVVTNDTLYLYGKTSNNAIALARVSVASVEDRNQYSYWVNGTWSSSVPPLNSTDAAIPHAGAGGQGTFYYSAALSSYVWIGQASESLAADFFITTAPAPQGPWIEPYTIFQGTNGNGLGSYSLQANPALLPSGASLTGVTENAIYITWTQNWNSTTYPPGYVTPLVYIEFE